MDIFLIFVFLQLLDVLDNDYKDWDNEYAAIPDKNRSAAKKHTITSGIPDNLEDFSQCNIFVEGVKDGDPNFSMGQFFGRKCEHIRDMIPNSSPKKKLKQYGLIQSNCK